MENKEFEEIYRENAAIVLRYLLRIGCPMEDVEDIVQETFVKAIISIDSFRGDCKLSVWLCQIAKNNFYDLLKKRKRECSEQNMVLSYQDNNEYLELLDLIESLAEPYRTVFIKRELEGCTYPDIAKIFGETENWARVTFFRAKKKVQKLFNLYLKEGSK